LAEDVVRGGREQTLADREFVEELHRSGSGFDVLGFEGFQLLELEEPLMLQLGESLPHPAKENPFGIVYLKFPNEPSLSTA